MKEEKRREGGREGGREGHVHTFELVKEEDVGVVFGENVAPRMQGSHGPKSPTCGLDGTDQACI